MMSPDFWYSLPVLTGRRVRLEPLSLEHAAGYHAAGNTGSGNAGTVAEAIRQIAGALAARARGERLAYALVDVATGTFVGSTSFCRIDPARRSIGIGDSWLGARWSTAGHATEADLLMLTYALDALGAVRMCWHVAAADTQARAHLERLGVDLEGVLRKHSRDPDGSWTDSAQYAMTDDDWPRVRSGLTERVAGTARM